MTKLLNPKLIIPLVCEVFGIHAASLLHGDSSRTLTLAKWCCFYFMRRYSHVTPGEIGEVLQTDRSSVINAIKGIDAALAGTRRVSRFGRGPSAEAIRDAVTTCNAVILKAFPTLTPAERTENHRP